MSEDAPHYGPMTEQRAREILSPLIMVDGTLGNRWSKWPLGDDMEHAQLSGNFTADELEAIAWWMRNRAALEDGK